ncbi:MAG: Fibronectin type domain protein [Bacteroidetes bacterium]|nr:Fibronectin type domain protein [Bacteroidota bacterium]
MMKKLLFAFFLASTFGTTETFAQASCTPDLSCLGTATEGICPDSATGIPTANIGAAYNTTVSVKIPAVYTYMGTTYNLTHFVITNVDVDTTAGSTGSYVPLSAIGLTYLGSGGNSPSGGASGVSGVTMTQHCYWAAPGSACVVVSGTPTKQGTFPIRIKSQIRTLVFGSGVWIPAPDNTDYRMTVLGPAGVESMSAAKFEVMQNNPNPFSSVSKISFSSATPADVEFKVFNMLGSVVFSKTIKAEKGMNSYELDASSFSAGIYVYSMKSGDKTITKRMIVSGK